MLGEIEALTQEEIHELKYTVNQIMMDNGGMFPWHEEMSVDIIPSNPRLT